MTGFRVLTCLKSISKVSETLTNEDEPEVKNRILKPLMKLFTV